MSPLTVVILIFSVVGAVGYLLQDKFGLGKAFERGFMLLGTMCLSMIGMIVIAPLLASLIAPAFDFVHQTLGLDPSVIPASLLSNDMGGAPLAIEVAKNKALGAFNAYVVASMMGCTVSFTIPVAMKMVPAKNHRPLILGLLCGVVTIPVGCFVAGLICGLPLGALLFDLLPIVILSVVIALGLLFAPEASVKIFKCIGYGINALVVVGLVLGIINFLAKEPVIKGVATLEEGAMVCVNATVVMTGMFPLLKLLAWALQKPFAFLGNQLNMNETGMTGLVASMATSITTFGMTEQMDTKGVMLNAAFAVSGAFSLAGHLGFTMAYNPDYILPVVLGKLAGGVSAFLLALVLFPRLQKTGEQAAA